MLGCLLVWLHVYFLPDTGSVLLCCYLSFHLPLHSESGCSWKEITNNPVIFSQSNSIKCVISNVQLSMLNQTAKRKYIRICAAHGKMNMWFLEWMNEWMKMFTSHLSVKNEIHKEANCIIFYYINNSCRAWATWKLQKIRQGCTEWAVRPQNNNNKNTTWERENFAGKVALLVKWSCERFIFKVPKLGTFVQLISYPVWPLV